MKLSYIIAIVIIMSAVVACTKDIGPNPDLIPKTSESCDTVTFTKHIRPIVTNYCAISGCHVAGAQSPDLSDDNTLKAQADGGRIKARLIDQNDMPPFGNPAPTGAEIDLIKCWLNAGAPLN